MKTIFLSIPTYVYSSDLLRTNFITALAERFRVIALLPMASDSYPRHPNLTYVPWTLQFPEFLRFWGKTIRVPLIRMFDHEPLIQRNYQLSFGHWKRKLLRRAAFLFPKHFWNPDRIARFELATLPHSERFETLLREHHPSLVLTPTPGFTDMDAEAILLARRAGIPSVAMDFSWDNLTSNCKHLRRTDWLICWTERMAETAIQMHEFPPERVFVSGIMRFDHYFREDNPNLRMHPPALTSPLMQVQPAGSLGTDSFSNLLPLIRQGEVGRGPNAPNVGRSREEFLRSKGLNPREKTILITTVTKGNYFDEPKVARELIRARAEGRLPGFPNIFIRLHPKEDNYQDFEEFRGLPQVRVERAGKEQPAVSGQRIELDEADLVNLKDTLRHADVVVNYASTVTLEACVFDKPVVNIGFPAWYLNAYSFTHYKPVIELGAARITKSPEELIGEVGEYLVNPLRDVDNRRRAVPEFIGYTDGKSYERVVGYLERIASAATET